MNDHPTRISICRRGFSVIELLVVGSVLFVLMATLIPALLRARDSARRTQCANNLHQISLALNHYHTDMKMFPPGCVDTSGPVPNAPVGYQFGWIVQLLPRLEQNNLYQTLDFRKGAHNIVNTNPAMTRIPPLICPSDHFKSSAVAGSSYSGCIGGSERIIDSNSSGVMYLNSSICMRQIADGLTNTILAGETRCHDGLARLRLGWVTGTAATLRSTAWPINGEFVDIDTDECGGFGSYHGDMAMFVFADGSARPLATEIDPMVLEYLGDRDDGQLVTTRTEQDERIDKRRSIGLRERVPEKAE